MVACEDVIVREALIIDDDTFLIRSYVFIYNFMLPETPIKERPLNIRGMEDEDV